MTHPDREFLESLLRKEEGAWERFLERYGPLIARAGRLAGLGNPQDLASEVYTQLLDQDGRLLRSFRGDSALSTWIWCIAWRAALAQRRRPPLSGGPSRIAEVTEDPLVLQEEIDRLRLAMERLPERARQALRMATMEERTYAEIGRVLGVSPSSIGPLLARAKVELLTIMKKS